MQDQEKNDRSGFTRRDLGRYAVTAAGFAALAPSLAGAATPEASPASPDRPRGGSVTVAQAGDPDTLDPQLTAVGIAGQIYNNIFDTLIALKEDLTFEGILAESWEISKDGLTYTFHLRKGITFHDGTPFDSDAVKFTFDRLIDPKTNAVSYGQISMLKEAIAVDQYTVKLVLSEPFAPLLANLAWAYSGCILPRAAVEKMGNDFGKNPIGTGPWKFKEWVSGDHITLVRNENYQNFHSYMENKGAPYLDELIYNNIPEAATQVAAFESGEIQVFQFPPSNVQEFKANPDYQVYIPTKSTAIQFIEFAMAKPVKGQYGATFEPPFDDLRLRQAVGYAIDADPIMSGVLFGCAIRAYGPMPSGFFAYDPSIEQYGFHHDPDKAKSLLDEAGWTVGGDGTREKDGKKLELLLWTFNATPNDKTVQVIQNQLAAVGMSVKLDVVDVATFLATLVGGPENFDMTELGSADPNMLKQLIESNQPAAGYQNQHYVELVTQASTVTDSAERKSLYFQAQQQILADAAIIPLWSILRPVAVRDVKGFKLPPHQDFNTYEDLYYEK